MQLADLVVIYSLQLNNRCLRYLADCDVRGGAALGTQADEIHPDASGHESGYASGYASGYTSVYTSVYAEELLTLDSRRLLAMWDLFRRSLSADLISHIEAVDRSTSSLSGPTQKRVALRLASIAAQDEQAQAMVKVVRALPTDPGLSGVSWRVLNELFLRDSQYWRSRHSHAPVANESLVRRMIKNYRSGHRCHLSFMQEEGAGQRRWLQANASGWLEFAQLTVHQLELLRPRLSDKGKLQLWYLEKLADTLRTRVGLRQLRSEIKSVDINKAARKVARELVGQQIEKMDRRLDRLVRPSYKLKPKPLRRMVNQAIANSALEQVTMLATPAVKGGSGSMRSPGDRPKSRGPGKIANTAESDTAESDRAESDRAESDTAEIESDTAAIKEAAEEIDTAQTDRNRHGKGAT